MNAAFKLKLTLSILISTFMIESGSCQSCDFSFGDPISLNVIGTSPVGYESVYVLADRYGEIIDIQSNADFPFGTTESLVQVLAVSYVIGAPPNFLSIGNSIFDFSGCYCLSNHIWLLGCDSSGKVHCSYFVNDSITVNTMGTYNATPMCELDFVLADSQGVILSIESNPSFITPTLGGAYEFYALSHSTTNPIENLSLGNNMLDLINGCFERSNYIGEIICDPIALPVELIDFQASLNEKDQVDITWKTATERENDYFMIQRSQDLQVWEDIGKVNGAVNSNSMLSYGFVDLNPLKGISYYRLKQIDLNGEHTFSDSRFVERLISSLGLIYPNPNTGEFVVQTSNSKELFVQVFTMDGKQVKQIWVNGKVSLKLTTGVYYFIYQLSGKQYNEKVVVM
ncbi:MAG: T9SS type A sorting domain-containing protein [Crocinitomicaceae bacterium]|nr:T9SS type A sorting domain-containing protein [Crocinitomicaceae bacterium]